MALLDVDGLSVTFHSSGAYARAVEDVSFTVAEGETVALVGESGSGKSATTLGLLRLLPTRNTEVTARQVTLAGHDLMEATDNELRHIRGRDVAMIFQEPMTSLNPVFRIGEQIVEAIQLHRTVSRREAWRIAVEALDSVGIPDAHERARCYPHELSGGMRQRAMIAMAISCRPSLLVADEPTTALDVTVQAGILELIHELQRDLGMAVLLITHDMGVVAETADRVLVMYAGRIVEEAPVEELFDHPQHPYTQALLAAIPRLDDPEIAMRPIPGAVPDPSNKPPGCSFAPRCPIAEIRCAEAVPAPVEVAHPSSNKAITAHHRVRCFAIGSTAEYNKVVHSMPQSAVLDTNG